MSGINHWLWMQPKWVHKAIVWLTGHRLKIVMATMPDGSRGPTYTWVPAK